LDILSRISDYTKPPLIVAEMSGNHGGELDKALRLVVAAKEAGADAIKLQTYRPDTITVAGKDNRFLLKSGLWEGRYLYDLYQEAMTPWEWHPIIAEEAAKQDIICFSSPFDETAVDFLESSLCPLLYKVASFELNHFPLLEKIGNTGKPVLASTGVSQSHEIIQAIKVLKEAGCPEVILLHCVSEYPARPSDFCLQEMSQLKAKYDVQFGLSDHSTGHLIAVAATALGARVIEKHICLDQGENTVDGGFSMLPHEFAEMVDSVRIVQQSISGEKVPQASSFFKRSILVSSTVQKGDILTPGNLRIARPGDGLCPSRWLEVLDSYATRNLPIGHPLSEKDFIKPNSTDI
jgi:pseudaminic acid synthase